MGLLLKKDLFMTGSDKFWNWCKRKQLFSSIDISRYGLANYYLRANRTVREWSIPKEVSNIEPRLNRLSRKDKLFKGLIKDGNQMIAWYELNDNWLTQN